MRSCSVSLDRMPEVGDVVKIGGAPWRLIETEILGKITPDPDSNRRVRFFPSAAARPGNSIVRFGRAIVRSAVSGEERTLSILIDGSLSAAQF